MSIKSSRDILYREPKIYLVLFSAFELRFPNKPPLPVSNFKLEETLIWLPPRRFNIVLGERVSYSVEGGFKLDFGMLKIKVSQQF